MLGTGGDAKACADTNLQLPSSVEYVLYYPVTEAFRDTRGLPDTCFR